MSSFKNANKRFRKTNHERSQPSHRKKLGLLEKKKDYVKRARDYNEKKEKIRELQEKAALRNPDEFYFHMENSRLKDGKHMEESKSNVPAETLKKLKTRDQTYLTMEKQKEEKQVERLKSELHFIGAEKSSKHIVFVDSDENEDEDEAVNNFDVAKFFDTEPELLGRFHNRPRKKDLEQEDFEEPDEIGKRKRKKYKELGSRIKRKALLEEMLDEVETQKKLMAKGEKKKIVDHATGKVHYKWEPVRKK